MASHIDFGIKGDFLKVEEVTNFLGFLPTFAFNPNEAYIGKEKRGDNILSVEKARPPFGVWHFSTEGRIATNEIEDHAVYLLSKLKYSKEKINYYLNSNNYTVIISFWFEGPVGFDVSSKSLGQISEYCESFTFRFFES